MGIRQKLVIPTVLFSLLYAVAACILWWPRYANVEKNHFIEEQSRLLQVLAETLVEPIMIGDLAKAHSIIDNSLALIPSWQSLALYAIDGRQLYPPLSPPFDNGGRTDLATIKLPIGDGTSGYLRLSLNSENYITHEKSQVVEMAVYAGVFFMVAMLAALYVLTRQVHEPIKILLNAAKKIADGDFSAQLPPIRRDEIGELTSTFSEMRKQLSLTNTAIRLEANEALGLAKILEEKERRLDSIFNSVEEGIVTVDEYGIIESVNKAICGISGYAPDELIGRSIEILFPDGIKPRYDMPHADELKAQTPVPSVSGVREVTLIAKAGVVVSVEITFKQMDIRDAGLYVVVVRDITEKKRASDAFLKQRDIAQSYLDIAPVIFFSIDDRGIVHMVNSKACEVIGKDESAILGTSWFDYMDPNDRNDFAQYYRDYAQKDDELLSYIEFGIIDVKGATRTIAWQCVPIMVGENNRKGMLCAGQDITDQRESEKEKLKMRKQIQQAQKMEAVGQLTGGIAHDFNNILMGMMGYTELALYEINNGGAGDIKGYLDEVFKAGKRAKDLIGKMLAFSRGKVASTQAPLELTGLIAEAVKLLRALLPSSLEIRTELDASCPPVRLSSVDVQQIIMNLCINARDAMNGKGSITITLKNAHLDHGTCSSCHQVFRGEYVAMRLSDDGAGMPDEVKSRAFEPFFSTKEVGKGTGMGLAVVHGIVHGHKGHIVLTSEIGVGTSFAIYFPVTTANSTNIALG